MNREAAARCVWIAFVGIACGFAGCGADPPASRVAAPTTGSRPTEEEVCKIAAEMMGLERAKVSPETSLADLRADELDFVELIMELEERFDVSIPDDAAEAMLGTKDWQQGMNNVTMRKLAAIIDERKQASANSSSSP